MQLAKTYLIPVLLNGSEIFGNCITNNRRKLYIFLKERRDHVSQLSYRIYGINFDNLFTLFSSIRSLPQNSQYTYLTRLDLLDPIEVGNLSNINIKLFCHNASFFIQSLEYFTKLYSEPRQCN